MEIRRIVLLTFALLAATPARAAVTITFYSHSLGTYGLDIAFPHAYFTLRGTTVRGNLPVKGNFGFSATSVTPAMLMGPVEGALDVEPDDYVAEGTPHFSMTLSDAQYAAVLAVIKKWREYPQPSYELDSHNCVTFVEEAAAATGLSIPKDYTKFIRAPSEFLDYVKAQNAQLLGHDDNGKANVLAGK